MVSLIAHGCPQLRTSFQPYSYAGVRIEIFYHSCDPVNIPRQKSPYHFGSEVCQTSMPFQDVGYKWRLFEHISHHSQQLYLMDHVLVGLNDLRRRHSPDSVG
jgi:hypothetical protein